MTGAGGTSREDATSRDEAAGGSPTCSANAVKRRGRWRAAFFALALAGIAGAAVWALFGSRLLAVRSVVVTGTHLVPRSEVLAVAGIRPGTPLIRLNTARIAARVDTIGPVRSAQVTRSWPDRVVIVVRERSPALALAVPGGGYDLVDPDGVVVRQSAARPAGLPLYLTAVPAGALRGDPDLAAATAVLGELPAALRREVASVAAPGPDQVTLRLAGGITVLWGGADRAGDKAAELAVLMRAHARYCDVSGLGSVLIK